MSKKTIGCLVMLLVLALVVTGAVYGIRALVNRNNDKPSAEESGEVMEANPAAGEETAGETIPEIDQSLTPDAAFALGNDAYEAGDYPLSEAYYRHAVNLDASSSIYRNNLGLALLQREENGEALELFSALVEEEPNTYGYWVNLLVAAHANGIPSNEIFAAKGGYDIMPQLVAASVENPFVYKKVLEAILYNAVYMDIELDGSEMHEKGFKYSGEGEPSEAEAVAEASGDYSPVFYSMLSAIDLLNNDAYGESDPDIAELTAYLDAKTNQ